MKITELLSIQAEFEPKYVWFSVVMTQDQIFALWYEGLKANPKIFDSE